MNLRIINFSEKNNMKKFKVYFYFCLNKNQEYILNIESDLLNIYNQYGYDLIRNIIKKINNESIVINNDSKKYSISLKDCENEDNNFYINDFEIRKCKKKSLKPNKELPPFYSSSLLKNLIEDSVSLICKNNLNIMLIEKDNDIEEEKFGDYFFKNHEKYANIKINLNQRNNKYICKYEKCDDNKYNNCLII